MPASVEIFTKTHEFLRTNVSIFVTLIVVVRPDGGRIGAFGGEQRVQPEQRPCR